MRDGHGVALYQYGPARNLKRGKELWLVQPIEMLNNWREMRISQTDGIERLQVVIQAEEEANAIPDSLVLHSGQRAFREERIGERWLLDSPCTMQLKGDGATIECNGFCHSSCREFLLPFCWREVPQEAERFRKIEWCTWSKGACDGREVGVGRHGGIAPSSFTYFYLVL